MNIQFVKFIIFLSVLFFVKRTIAQSSVTFDVGQVFSTYLFTDDKGNSEKDFTNNITGCFSLGYQYKVHNGLFIRTNLGMRKASDSKIYN